MALPQALLFDVDGTLADTERDGHRVAFNRAFQDAGLNWDWTPALYGELLAVAGGKERIQYFIDTQNPDYPSTANLTNWIAELHKSKTQHYKQLLAAGTIPLRPGVKRLIDEARRAGVRIAISTTTTPDNVYALLENALAPGSTDWFEVIAAGDVVPAKKPAPDIYFYAMSKMNLEPDACLAFEDSYNGVRSSLQARLKTIITLNDYTKKHDFSGATLVLSDMGEPDAPFTVISGSAGNSQCLDLALIDTMF